MKTSLHFTESTLRASQFYDLFLPGWWNVWKVLCAPPHRWVGRSTPGDGIRIPSIHASRRKSLAVNRFDKDPGDLLRKSSMLGGRSSAERFL
jgi:hypothetical protein